MTGASSFDVGKRHPLPRGVVSAEHGVAGEHDEMVVVDDPESRVATGTETRDFHPVSLTPAG